MSDNFVDLNTIINYASYIAVVSYGISGAIVAIRHNFDFLGILFITIINTVGGGLMRDALINKIHMIFYSHIYIILILISIGLVHLLKLERFKQLEQGKIYVFCDALGLAAFSITGGMIAMNANLNLFSILFFAFLIPTGGTILRSTLIKESTSILNANFYGSIALILGASLYVLRELSMLNYITMILLFFIGVSLRLTSYKYNKWKLPFVE